MVEKVSPGWMLSILLAELAVLLVYLWSEIVGWFGLDSVPNVIAGVVPVVVPWGGAVGGVAIGLVSLSQYWRKFYNKENELVLSETRQWNTWYLTRLPLGAVFGTVAALIVVLFLGTIGLDAQGAIDASPIGQATLLVIAFAVGYKSDIFRELLTRLIAVILGPGERETPASAISVEPSDLPFDDTKVGTSSPPMELAILNDSTRATRFPVTAFKVSDAAFTVTQRPGIVPGGQSGVAKITFTPTEEKEYKATMTITADKAVTSVNLTGKGTST